ncbi:MAG: T9SS type A sorting domain-containing protein [Saprospiraceae bacterium]
MKSCLIYTHLFLFLGYNARSQSLKYTELLGRPKDKSITVQVFFNSPAEICAQYGTTTSQYSNQTSWQLFGAGDPAEIVIDNLKPNTKYFYRVCYRQPNTTSITYRPEYTFFTQRSVGNSFTFTVEADPHLDEQSDSAIYKLCLQNQLDDKPDFMIDLGDFLMSDKLKNKAGKITRDTVIYRSNLFRSYYDNIGHSVPIFIALGNHEGESGWNLNNTAENLANWSSLERKKYFVNPAPDNFYSGDATIHPFVGQRENYYSWTWGDAQFIVIDPYWYTKTKPDAQNGWRWTLGKTQYDWLKSTLENSTSRFKFVFAHQLVGGDPNGRGGVEFAHLYEWGGKNLDGSDGFATNRPGWYKPIKDLLEENRVNIFFHGHDHFFGKQEKNCLVYQETPQPSHPNFQSTTYATDYGYKEGQILPNSGHIRVTVDPEGVKVDYVRVYLPKSETGNRKNKDISATYFIGKKNCYDLTAISTPVLWNSNYSDELIYPNPFSNETRIEFNVLQAEHLSISISNEQGQKVRTLLSTNLVNEGKYQIIWDGKDNIDRDLQNGVYFYTIEGDRGSWTSGKIMLLR